MYCSSKIRGERENKKFSGSAGEEKERGELKQESETETKMVLGGKKSEDCIGEGTMGAWGEKSCLENLVAPG